MAEGNWKSIAATIAARIASGELAPGLRLPSGDGLAREMGVNRNVVHRALEELQRQGFVVRRQGSGTVVAARSARKTARIALLVDGYSAMHNFPSGDLLRGVHDRIGEESTLVIADSKRDPVLEARQLRRLSREVDGVLLYACAPDRSAAAAALLCEGYPLVALDRMPQGVEIDAAMTDNRGTTRAAVQSLIDRGHRRIALLGIQKLSFSSVVERHQGYRDAMETAGLADDELVCWLPEGIDDDALIFQRIVRDAVLGLRHGVAPATAMLCVEDGLGCAAVLACERLGIVLPTDLEIATYIDWHPMTLHTPWNVRRIVQRKYDLGHAAAGLLLDRIASPARPHETIRIEADIIPADADFQESLTSSTAIQNPTRVGHHP